MTRDYRVVPSELTVRATTSTPIQFELYNGTARLDLTSYTTIDLWLKDKSGGTTKTDNTGQLSVNGTAGGSVRWTPGTATLKAGSAPYQAYFRLHSGPGLYLFVPEANEFTINVRETF